MSAVFQFLVPAHLINIVYLPSCQCAMFDGIDGDHRQRVRGLNTSAGQNSWSLCSCASGLAMAFAGGHSKSTKQAASCSILSKWEAWAQMLHWPLKSFHSRQSEEFQPFWQLSQWVRSTVCLFAKRPFEKFVCPSGAWRYLFCDVTCCDCHFFGILLKRAESPDDMILLKSPVDLDPIEGHCLQGLDQVRNLAVGQQPNETDLIINCWRLFWKSFVTFEDHFSVEIPQHKTWVPKCPGAPEMVPALPQLRQLEQLRPVRACRVLQGSRAWEEWENVGSFAEKFSKWSKIK